MKPIRIVLSPTRSRPANIFLGLVLVLVSLLVLLALATWHASDLSLNTATGEASPHNWVGLFGSYFSDLMLQSVGLTAFLLPLWLGGIGWTWMRSRPSGSPLLRWSGTVLALSFLPAAFGLMPWHWRWLHVLPVEGVVGRLMAGLLVEYLNIQGAWLVAAVLAATGFYFASAISFWAIKESLGDYWLHVRNWLDRWRNWREERAEQREENRLYREAETEEENAPGPGLPFIPASGPEAEAEHSARRTGFFAALMGRGKRKAEGDPLDEIPAFRRAPLEQAPLDQANPVRAGLSPANPGTAEEEIPIAAPVRRTSIWERAEAETVQPAAQPVAQSIPQNVVPIQPAAARVAETRAAEPRSAVQRPAEFQSEPAPAQKPAGEIAIHGRADAEIRTATVAPKNVSGFKLPPSMLLNPGDGPQKVREDELREEAKVLVEKCAEFDVRGQVVQINPGPMVTTYEFKPEAGVKYSRVTGLADDLCLAMRAESILIERMAGKSTVGIQVPNHERETIHLRDVLESETFSKAK